MRPHLIIKMIIIMTITAIIVGFESNINIIIIIIMIITIVGSESSLSQ